MVKTARLLRLTPEEVFFEDDIAELVIPVIGGKEGFLPNRQPVMKLMTKGDVKITMPDGEVKIAEIKGGQFVMSKEILMYIPELKWKQQ